MQWYIYQIGQLSVPISFSKNLISEANFAIFKVALTEALLELLLNEKVEPKDIYVFPQKIHAHIKFNRDRAVRDDENDCVTCVCYIQFVS